MTDPEFDTLVRAIDPLLACFIVEASSGALHREFRRDEVPVEPDVVARAVAGLARAQTDVVGLAQPATLTTLEWPGVIVIVRSLPPAALAVFFFEPESSLGLARMHVNDVVERLEGHLPDAQTATVRGIPAVTPPAGSDLEAAAEADSPGVSPSATTRELPAARVSNAGALLEYLERKTPDVNAALIRVSLQTGLPLPKLKTPERLSVDEFARVTESVRRILGVDELPF